jgi:hypothetical protein
MAERIYECGCGLNDLAREEWTHCPLHGGPFVCKKGNEGKSRQPPWTNEDLRQMLRREVASRRQLQALCLEASQCMYELGFNAGTNAEELHSVLIAASGYHSTEWKPFREMRKPAPPAGEAHAE